MAKIHFDSDLSDDDRRRRIYAGDIFILSPTEASLALCDFAYEMLAEAFAPHDPETAQQHFSVEEYAAILAELKPSFIHHPKCKELIPEILSAAGCDNQLSYFDVPRLRTSTSDGYLTSGIAYAFHPHRDTWYSAPPCQINWWMPVRNISPDNGMAFLPRYFSEGVKNSSRNYDYYRWNEQSRKSAAKHIGKDTREQPKAEEPLELAHDIRLAPPVGGIILFSAAQLHASVPNQSGKTRISIDFRVVNETDVRNQQGAENVDSECTGTTMRDYLNCETLDRLSEELVTPYETQDVSADAVKIYSPD